MGQKPLCKTIDTVGPQICARPYGDAPFSVLALHRDQTSITACVTMQWAHLFLSLSPGCELLGAGTRLLFQWLASHCRVRLDGVARAQISGS